MNRLYSIATTTVMIVASAIFFSPSASAVEIDLWWPVEGAEISGTQPVKALLKDTDPKTYQMFWQVDNGQWNWMADDAREFPHKEALVDMSGWTWRENAIYRVRIIATDLSGQPFVDKEISIKKKTITTSVPSVTPSPTPVMTIAATPTPTPGVAKLTATTSSTPLPEARHVAAIPTTTTVRPSLDMWWPTSGATISGKQIFKGMLRDTELSEYSMYWQVDGDRLNPMMDSNADWPHKEDSVDLSNWNWRDGGTYRLTFIAKNKAGATIAEQPITVSVYNAQRSYDQAPIISASAIASVRTPLPAPVITPVAASGSSSNPFSNARLDVNPNNEISGIAQEWRRQNNVDAQYLEKIAAQPETQWFGNWNNDVERDARNATNDIMSRGALPVFVAYNIPGRDCGGYSAGGSQSPSAYRSWIRSLAHGIGSSKAVVLLEPDALPGMDCLSRAYQDTRLELLRDAVRVLRDQGNISVYIDAGHALWKNPEEMASRLNRAGIAEAQGFSLNIANFVTTPDSVRYGTAISNLIGGKHFVVDTARNGLGSAPDREWCNPPGRALGNPPGTSTGNILADAFLWVKGPGGSDGACNGAPPAGVAFPEYAVGLAKRAAW